jgi:tetratricopeptide (TPR) repeat protein
MSQFEEAISHFRASIHLDARMAAAYSGLGVAQAAIGLYSQAYKDARHAVTLNPQNEEFHRNLANVLVRKKRLKEAHTVYEHALEINPRSGETHFQYSWSLLLAGEFQRGWLEYEWRWYSQGRKPRRFNKPRWDGSPLGGKTILLYSEQGYGDAIQFLRFIPQVKNMGGVIIFECPQRLMRLAETVNGVDIVLEQGKPLPDFDVEAPLLSLPSILSIDFDTITARVPYLEAVSQIPESLESLLHYYDSYIKIGIVWAGNPNNPRDSFRSCPLSEFTALASLDGVKLFSLQIDLGADTALPGNIDDLASYQHDFSDAAAIIEHLDLVITVDTAIAHLAGALGRPVWTLVCTPPDWRWMLDREDTPWYPTMRLFRQELPYHWGPVFDEVCHELTELAAQHRNMNSEFR